MALDLEAIKDRAADALRRWSWTFDERPGKAREYASVVIDAAVPELVAEVEQLRERTEWWQDSMSGLLAMIDGYYMLPREIDPEAKLQQVRQELRDMGVEWESDWTSDNQRLAERAEAAEARNAELVTALEQARELLARFLNGDIADCPPECPCAWSAARAFLATPGEETTNG